MSEGRRGSSRSPAQPGCAKPQLEAERQWRSLSSDEMNAVKMAQLGGFRAAMAWGEALDALHDYAQKSDCPAGYDVVRWFEERSDAYRTALTAEHYTLPSPPHDEQTARQVPGISKNPQAGGR